MGRGLEKLNSMNSDTAGELSRVDERLSLIMNASSDNGPCEDTAKHQRLQYYNNGQPQRPVGRIIFGYMLTLSILHSTNVSVLQNTLDYMMPPLTNGKVE